MSLTITIPGAINVTTGAIAPAVLTIGVGVPGAAGPQGQAGQGVPAGGLTGQILSKASGTSYDTAWTTLSLTGYATESWVTAGFYPLSSNPSGYLTSSALTGYATQSFVAANYAPIAAGLPTGGTVGQVLTKNSGTDYDDSWQTLIPGDRYVTSSTTSNTIGNGAKTFTVGTGLSYSSQQDVVISFDASNHMHAVVTSYNSGTGVLVVDVKSHTGSGTYSSWTVNVGGTTPLQTVEWGEILGTLGDQSDLASALSAKLETSTAASTYAALAGATFTGEVITPASTTSNAGLTITPGVAPTTPTNGEIWATTNDLQVRLNGVTETLAEQSWVTAGFYPLSGNPSGFLVSSALTPYALLSGATFTGLISTLAPTTATAGLRLPHGTAPTSPVNGDVWTTTSGLFARINGGTQQYAPLGSTNTFTGTNTFSGATLSFGTSTAASTINVGTGATLTATTKAVNIGTNGVAGSTTNIAIGSTTGTSTTTLQGTTNGVTAAADTNSVALATTAFVIGQAGSATPLVDGTAAVGTSLRYARQDHVHPTDTTRAPSASPTFTGTPLSTTAAVDTNTTQIATTAYVVGQGYLKSATASTTYAPLASPALTGTPTAPTATAGTNTTQIATTAFVTAAVPALATTADINSPSSTTKVTSLDAVRRMLLHPGFQLLYLGPGQSQTALGGYFDNNLGGRWKQFDISTTSGSRSQYTFDNSATSLGLVATTRGQSKAVKDYSKKIYLTGRVQLGTPTNTQRGDNNSIARINLGGKNGFVGGDLSAIIKGFGWKVAGVIGNAMELQVSNGTTLTTVTSSFVPVSGQIFDWELYSDGTGNVTLTINDNVVATTTAGPTGTNATGLYLEGVDAIAASVSFAMESFGTKIYFSS